MGGVALRSGALYDVLNSLGGSPTTDAVAFDSAALSGLSAREIVDAIVEFVSPSDGTQDSETSQHAIAEALSDLLDEYPDADLGALPPTQIDWVLERHLVHEIDYRVQLDVGRAIQDNAPSIATAVVRLREMREYIEEAVASVFREHRAGGGRLTSAQAISLATGVLEDTFAVFEEYVG